MKIFAYCLPARLFLTLMLAGGLSTVCFFASCSSNSTPKSENKSLSDSAVSVDTSLHGLVGVIEKNPPVQQGDYIAKYPSGIVKMRGFYINGKREGQWVSFLENGKIQSEGFFKAGLRDGKALVYFENGQVYYEGYYKEGKEVGKWIFYDQQGKKINEKDYDGSPSLRDKPNS